MGYLKGGLKIKMVIAILMVMVMVKVKISLSKLARSVSISSIKIVFFHLLLRGIVGTHITRTYGNMTEEEHVSLLAYLGVVCLVGTYPLKGGGRTSAKKLKGVGPDIFILKGSNT